jgi:23S rRNA pseudouridine1911/1915/1917 synthase
VLYEDKHLIVVNKPPGTLSQGGAPPGGDDDNDMLSLVKAHLATAGGKPSKAAVYVGLVHRLDRNVSGAMVFARRSKAAARLGEAFRTHAVRKVYLAVVLGEVAGGGVRTLRHALAFTPQRVGGGKVKKGGGAGAAGGGGGNLTRVVGDASSVGSGGGVVIGTLRYEPLLAFPHPHPRRPHERETLLRIELLSGRKHQIRAQLSHVGHPIVGDVKYGAPVALRDRSIALHCRVLAFVHPKRGGEEDSGGGVVMKFQAPLPASWRARFGQAVVAAVEGVR